MRRTFAEILNSKKQCTRCKALFNEAVMVNGVFKRYKKRWCQACYDIFNTTEQRVISDYSTHGSGYCMKTYNLTRDKVYDIAKKYKLHVEKHVISKNISIACLKSEDEHEVDHRPFVNITDPMYAYILGLIWTDGTVQRDTNSIFYTTTRPDSDYFYPQFLKTGNWRNTIHVSNIPNHKDTFRIYTTNQFFREFLLSHNYRDKERGIGSIYNHIPKQFRKYFIIGMIDGDGCFHCNIEKYSYRFSITSSYGQDWGCLESVFNKLNLKNTITRRCAKNGSRCSRINIIGKNRIKALGDYLYDEYIYNKIGLPRKYDKYCQIKEACLTNIHKLHVPQKVEPIFSDYIL